MVKHEEFVKLCLHLKCVCVRVIKENVSTEMMVAGGGGGTTTKSSPLFKKISYSMALKFSVFKKASVTEV